MAYIVTILLCIAADQAVKLWTVANLALFETKPLLPGLVELCYVQNTGGGFSILTEHTWRLTVGSVFFSVTGMRGKGKRNNLEQIAFSCCIVYYISVRKFSD